MEILKGDLFDYVEAGDCIPHVCNNKRAWGAGFVLPLAEHYPIAKFQYLQGDCKLGETGFAYHPGDDVTICNMVAQTLGGERPLRYDALVRCMMQVTRRFLRDGGSRIICPQFGAHLAGGDWEFIQELIADCWESRDIPVTVVEYQAPEDEEFDDGLTQLDLFPDNPNARTLPPNFLGGGYCEG